MVLGTASVCAQIEVALRMQGRIGQQGLDSNGCETFAFFRDVF